MRASWSRSVPSSDRSSSPFTISCQLLDGGELVLDSKEGKSRRKPLPATYEPGIFRAPLFASGVADC